MRKKYKRLTYTFENAIEVYEYLDGRYGAPGMPRRKKKKATPEQIEARNQWNREKKARHILRTWFKKNDYFVCWTYAKEARPPDMEIAKEHFKKAIGYVRKQYRKRGYELRWVRNIEVGTKNAWHIHVIVNRIPDTDIIMREAWKYGGENFKLLYEKGDFADLAKYITKTPKTDRRLRETNYSHSRNLPVKEPEVKYLERWQKEPKPKKGYYIEKESFYEGMNDFTGYKYRCYTMIRLNRRI